MNLSRMVKVVLLLALLAAGLFVAAREWKRSPQVASFEECVAAGNPVMESYPQQCRIGKQVFREDIGNELEKDDLIRLASPRPNDEVATPLTVRGVARGNWFFEASFPILVVDWDGKIIGQGLATAEGDPATGGVNWMTADFVPFVGVVAFDTTKIQGQYLRRAVPAGRQGTLILRKDNPSGLSEHDDALEIPIKFR